MSIFNTILSKLGFATEASARPLPAATASVVPAAASTLPVTLIPITVVKVVAKLEAHDQHSCRKTEVTGRIRRSKPEIMETEDIG
ncbi:MAG: hypothetical protein V2J11_02375 [Desulfofustis sp.]|jgi:hypothetical protein|nr:hypothetical protein [Desulfofustis sp.]